MSDKFKFPMKAMALTSTILSQLAGTVLVGIFFGKWLDKQASTSPLFLIVFLFLGLSAGVYAVIQTLKKFDSGDT